MKPRHYLTLGEVLAVFISFSLITAIFFGSLVIFFITAGVIQ